MVVVTLIIAAKELSQVVLFITIPLFWIANIHKTKNVYRVFQFFNCGLHSYYNLNLKPYATFEKNVFPVVLFMMLHVNTILNTLIVYYCCYFFYTADNGCYCDDRWEQQGQWIFFLEGIQFPYDSNHFIFDALTFILNHCHAMFCRFNLTSPVTESSQQLFFTFGDNVCTIRIITY